MKFTKRFFATTLFIVGSMLHLSIAFEGDEEPCPAFANQTLEFPPCMDCVSAGCGYVTDEGDCVKDCSTVPDSACFSSATNPELDASGICNAATSNSTLDAGSGAASTTEETMCPESKGDTSTCELCVSAGCGWTADDGDCLLSCDEVNDGAECVSDASGCLEEADKASETSNAGKPQILKLLFVFIAAGLSALSTS